MGSRRYCLYIVCVFMEFAENIYAMCLLQKRGYVRVGGQNVVMNPSMFKEFDRVKRLMH